VNQGLYETVGRDWFVLAEADKVIKLGNSAPDYSDFLAYTFINLFRVVDLLGIAQSYNVVHLTYVHQSAWPSSTMLMLFRSFFTLVLLEQLFAAMRRGKLLADTITDFWSPHLPIHERARGSLPQHGPGAVRPLLLSLRSIEVLTAEQRGHLPRIIADIGPGAVPVLRRSLRDRCDRVRAVAAGALGHLHATDSIHELAALASDSNEWVRQSVAEALGQIAGPEGQAPQTRRLVRRLVRPSGDWFWHLFHRRRLQALPMVSPVEAAVRALRELLKDDVTAIRVQAAQSLGAVGKSATTTFPDLVAAIEDSEERVRCAAAEALCQVDGPAKATVDALRKALSEPITALRCAAARSLGCMKEQAVDAVPDLMLVLQDRDEALRKDAAEAIGKIGLLQQGPLDSMAEQLTHEDTVVRAQAAEMLGTIGPAAAGAAPGLVQALDDDNDRVRAMAARSLGMMGEAASDAVPRLVRALRDDDTWVRALAAEALGEIGGPAASSAIPALVRALKSGNPQVRANTATALGKLGNAAAAAVPELLAAAQDEDDGVRVQILLALGDIGTEGRDVSAVLVQAFTDANPEVRAAAIEAIGKHPSLGEAGIGALLAGCTDAADAVKVAAARALPKVAGESTHAVEILSRLLRDEAPEVQITAAQALGALGKVAQPAGPELAHAAQVGAAEVREQALHALALIQPPEAIQAFLGGLADPVAEIRKISSAGLILVPELSDAVVPGLVEALHDPETQVRANAARVLSRLENLPDAAVPLLIEGLAASDSGLRLHAVLALRRSGSSHILAAFEPLLNDPNPRLRLLVADHLLADRPGPAVGVIISALESPLVHIRRAALELIEARSDRAALLLDTLRTRLDAEENPELRAQIGRLLDRLTPPESTTVPPAPSPVVSEKSAEPAPEALA
jgi:HEAT repeat protein